MTAAPTPGEVADRFFAVANLLRKRANEGLREQGLTMARGKLLSILDRRGPTRISALGAKLGVAARTVTEAVDALERDGLAYRAPDPADRRAVLVTLTEQGAALIRAADGPRQEAMNRLFAALSAADRAALVRLLDTLDQAAGGPSAPTPGSE
ncbi:MarR family winged helix-turn-helix transcriptional regulator [Kitasatospora sp. NPDC052896]|uniref:MarR family winged helix-turn-helix transcriptional regulator n=1 Tax=Kitasatospora sp. NPDC052896 TaxID=3364061 RepID=UPI0037C76E95